MGNPIPDVEVNRFVVNVFFNHQMSMAVNEKMNIFVLDNLLAVLYQHFLVIAHIGNLVCRGHRAAFV